MTALLAAVATIATPLAGTAFAADPALTAPTYSPGCNQLGQCTSTANQPAFTATYNTALDPNSTASIIDTSASNAPVACTKSVSNNALSCTPTSSLVDGHVYKVSFNASNADDSSTLATTNNWTEDIPSFKSSSPADGGVVGSGSSPVSATYDEALDASSTITITDKDGNSTSGGTLSASTLGGPKDTVSFTPGSNGQGLPDGTYSVHVHAVAGADPSHGYADTFLSYTVNASTPQAAPTVTTAGYQATDASHWINSANEKAVPFSGTAEPNVRVQVVIYDPNTSPHPPLCSKGTCGNDRTANVGVEPCATPTTVNGVAECPWSLTIDTTTNGGTPDQSGYKWYAVAYTAGGSLSTAESTIGKDTVAPAAPNGPGTSASTVGSNNLLTVKTSDNDSSVDSYKFVATDAIGRTATDALVTVAGHACSGTLNPPKCAVDTFGVSQLQDGEDDYGTDSTTGGASTVGSSVAPGLVVDVYARDLAGNLSSKTSTSADKESVNLTPDLSRSYVTLSNGSTVPFSALDPSNPPQAIQRPTAVTVWFNELIRPNATSNALVGSVAMTTNLSVLSHNGFPLSGAPSITDGGFSLTWKLSGSATDSGSPYSITNLKAVAGSCPDDGADPSQTTPGSGNGYCETYQSTSPLAVFAIDTVAPNVHVTGVNGAGVNNGIDGTDIGGTVISGTVDPDATQVSLTLQSTGHGTVVVPASSVSITAPGAGQSLATWQTSPQNLTTLGDGTVTIVAWAEDGAGNSSSLDPTVANPDGSTRSTSTTMQARPTAPQNLSAAAGNGQAVLTWITPASTGGVPLTGYSVTVTDTSVPGSAVQTLPVDGSATTYTVTGLANGHSYSFALTAANNIGSGPAATTSGTPKGNTAVSVIASRGTITYSQFLQIHGTLSYFGVGLASEPVTITTIYFNGHHGPTYHVTTDQYGNWVVAGLSPGWNVTYVATFGGDSAYNPSSGAAGVRVRVRIRILHASSRNRSHYSPVTLKGNVRPNHRYRRVYVYELRAHGRLHYLGYTKLTRRSTWFFTRKFARGRHILVARFLTQQGNYGNWSNRIRFWRS